MKKQLLCVDLNVSSFGSDLEKTEQFIQETTESLQEQFQNTNIELIINPIIGENNAIKFLCEFEDFDEENDEDSIVEYQRIKDLENKLEFVYLNFLNEIKIKFVDFEFYLKHKHTSEAFLIKEINYGVISNEENIDYKNIQITIISKIFNSKELVLNLKDLYENFTIENLKGSGYPINTDEEFKIGDLVYSTASWKFKNRFGVEKHPIGQIEKVKDSTIEYTKFSDGVWIFKKYAKKATKEDLIDFIYLKKNCTLKEGDLFLNLENYCVFQIIEFDIQETNFLARDARDKPLLVVLQKLNEKGKIAVTTECLENTERFQKIIFKK